MAKKKPISEQVVVIGDTPLDIRCARAISAKVLAVATGTYPVEELKSHHPDWAVEDLTKISVNAIAGPIGDRVRRKSGDV